jgi:hypothetical protein
MMSGLYVATPYPHPYGRNLPDYSRQGKAFVGEEMSARGKVHTSTGLS